MSYAVHAVRYARHDRQAHENFLDSDPHDGPMPLDYFVWAIVGPDRTFVVDTGFGAAEASARGRELIRSPGDGLRAIGIDPARVADAIVTHMQSHSLGGEKTIELRKKI